MTKLCVFNLREEKGKIIAIREEIRDGVEKMGNDKGGKGI